jgi:hypothetical protein
MLVGMPRYANRLALRGIPAALSLRQCAFDQRWQPASHG